MSLKQKSILKKYPLFTRMVFYIIAFGILIAVITTFSHFRISYSLEIKRLKTKLDLLEKEQIPLLINSLWSFDQKSINIQLKSILSDSDLVYVEIRKGDAVQYTAGNPSLRDNNLNRTYSLVYQNKTLGDVSFFATSQNIKDRIFVDAIGSLIAQFMAILLICLFMAGLMFTILTKPISQLLNFTKTIKLDNLDDTFSLNRTNKRPDEFDTIADTLDSMRRRLKEGMEEKESVEKELLAEQAFTQKALNAQQDTFFLFEPATGKAIRWNRAFNKLSGYSDDEITQLKAPEAYYSAEDLEKAGACIENVFNTRAGTVELNLIAKDGHRTPTEYSVSMIHDDNHQPKYFISIGRDLTERKQLETKFQQLAENSTDWIWEFDENNIFTYSSPGIRQLLGYTPQEIIGRSAFDLMPAPERKKVAREFEAIKSPHKSFTNLVNINQHKDGYLVTIESSGSPIFDPDGNFKGYRGIDRDISLRKKMEDELRQAHKMESIGTLAGGIAHDFNNILGIIIGNAELALNDMPDWNPSYTNIEKIKTASLRAKNVVRQLLSFSRKTEQEKKSIDIREVVKESIQLIRASLPSNIDIRENTSTQIDPISADATQIHQVLINLCTNASHAMAESGGVLEITLLPWIITKKTDGRFSDLSPGSYVKLIVTDSGSGIDSGIHDKVFDPYFTTKEVGKGTGMGLAVVHGIVKNHNGEIYLDSELGKGTSFTIVFPSSTKPSSDEEPDPESRAASRGKESILFVDDEEDLVELARNILGKFGYRVQTDIDPRAALNKFKEDPAAVDLVITDMTMPQMSGVELAEEIRKIRPDIPIIICTGHSSLVNEEKAAEIGVSAFAMKPVTMLELDRLIQNVLET